MEFISPLIPIFFCAIVCVGSYRVTLAAAIIAATSFGHNLPAFLMGIPLGTTSDLDEKPVYTTCLNLGMEDIDMVFGEVCPSHRTMRVLIFLPVGFKIHIFYGI